MAVATNPLESFIWGEGGSKKTPEQIARERAIAEALMAQGVDTSPVAHWAQGLARVANAGAGALKDYRLDKAEGVNAEASQSRIAQMLSGLGGGASAYPSASPAGDYASARVAQSHGDGDVISAKLVERGLPKHVADAFVMNFQDESALNPGINETSPTVPGSRGGYGLYQLTGPRRRAYEAFAQERGVDPADTDAQLDFMMLEGQGPEKAAFDAILAAPDTGAAAAAIVNKFLRPAESHRRSREARYLRTGGGAPVQVASLDPAAGMENLPMPALQPQQVQAVVDASQPQPFQGLPPGVDPQSLIQPAQATPSPRPGVDVGAPGAVSPAGQRVVQQMVSPQSMTGGAPMPMMGQPAADPVQRIAQAMNPNDPSTIPAMAGGTQDVIPQGQTQAYGAFPAAPGAAGAPQGGAGDINPAIMQALSSPYASPQEKQIAGILLQQQMQQSDPMRAIEMERAQLELQQMRNPPPNIPDSVRALDIRAQQAGLQPGTKEYSDFMISGGRGPQTIVNTGQGEVGTIPQGFELFTDPNSGGRSLRPIPGGPAEAEAKAAQAASAAKSGQTERYGNVVIEDIDRAVTAIEKSPALTTGLIGQWMAGVAGTPAHRVGRLLETVKANAGFDRLQAMRDSSPTGGALGAVNQTEMSLLQSAIGNLEQSQTSDDLTYNLRRVQDIYNEIIHGRGGAPKKPTVIDGFTIEEVQ